MIIFIWCQHFCHVFLKVDRMPVYCLICSYLYLLLLCSNLLRIFFALAHVMVEDSLSFFDKLCSRRVGCITTLVASSDELRLVWLLLWAPVFYASSVLLLAAAARPLPAVLWRICSGWMGPDIMRLLASQLKHHLCRRERVRTITWTASLKDAQSRSVRRKTAVSKSSSAVEVVVVELRKQLQQQQRQQQHHHRLCICPHASNHINVGLVFASPLRHNRRLNPTPGD